MNALERILDQLSDIRSINSGGCGLAALAVYQWTQRNDPSAEVHFLFTYSWGRSNVRTNMQAIESNDYTDAYVPSHILTVVNGNVYDSHGYHGPEEDFVEYYEEGYVHTAPLDFLIRVIEGDTINGWNDMFNRYRNVPRIESVIGEPLQCNW